MMKEESIPAGPPVIRPVRNGRSGHGITGPGIAYCDIPTGGSVICLRSWAVQPQKTTWWDMTRDSAALTGSISKHPTMIRPRSRSNARLTAPAAWPRTSKRLATALESRHCRTYLQTVTPVTFGPP